MIGFMDEASPQTTANTVRLWSPDKPGVVKNTDRIKANAMGFLSMNGTSAISFPNSSKASDVCSFLNDIRNANGNGDIIIILDNFRSHHSKAAKECAESLNIHPVFLPPYSPHLNPIEFIWKKLKRSISKNRMIDRDHMTSLLEERFRLEASNTSYFEYWKELFYEELIKIVW
ncbi:MAG: IS630 family transposase [Candidatus Methanoplasma sp.]|nr:IS630 family transposase [Candidatus Methanoplasma sp.]